MNMVGLKAREIQERLINKEISAFDIGKKHFNLIEVVDLGLNAFVTLNKDKVMEKCQALDEKILEGERLGALAGMTIGIKDNIITKDLKTTNGSKILEDFIPPYNSRVAEIIEENDGLIMGKMAMDEFGLGSYDGTASMVKAGGTSLGLGSDSNGALRESAALADIVGFKPTNGIISRYGLTALINTMDTIGIYSKDIKDTILLFKELAVYDERDSLSLEYNFEEIEDYMEEIKGMRIGLAKEVFEGLDQENTNRIMRAMEIFKDLGAEVLEVSIPSIEYALDVFELISRAEISSNLARYDGIRYGYRADDYTSLDELYIHSRTEALGTEVKTAILEGTYYLTNDKGRTHYEKATKLRRLIKNDFDKAFEACDLLITPTLHKFTIPVNLIGAPGLTVPNGYIDNRPFGLQIIGKRLRDRDVLVGGLAFEEVLNRVI